MISAVPQLRTLFCGMSAHTAALRTGASINGRLLAQTAVNLDSNAVVEPAP